MADEEYCTPEDCYQIAATCGSVDEPRREVASVDTVADVLELANHGCRLDDPIEFRTLPGGTLPAPLTASAVYRAKPVPGSDSLLQVAATIGGAAIDLTTAGEYFALVPNTREVLRSQIRIWSQACHRYIPSHAMPLEPDLSGRYPETVRQIVAVLATQAAFDRLGRGNVRLEALAERTRKDMSPLLAGIPPRDTKITTAPTNLAIGGSPGDASEPEMIP